jgi:hypothetical protein
VFLSSFCISISVSCCCLYFRSSNFVVMSLTILFWSSCSFSSLGARTHDLPHSRRTH